jgi:hypothetical protein
LLQQSGFRPESISAVPLSLTAERVPRLRRGKVPRIPLLQQRTRFVAAVRISTGVDSHGAAEPHGRARPAAAQGEGSTDPFASTTNSFRCSSQDFDQSRFSVVSLSLAAERVPRLHAGHGYTNPGILISIHRLLRTPNLGHRRGWCGGSPGHRRCAVASRFSSHLDLGCCPRSGETSWLSGMRPAVAGRSAASCELPVVAIARAALHPHDGEDAQSDQQGAR